MNDINKIVFDVYRGVLDMDYSKNEKKDIFKMISKLYRYIITGYIWDVKKIRKEMCRLNEFTPTQKCYEDVRFAIYTVSTGKYDAIKEPIYIDENIDYYVFTEQELSEQSIWKKKEIPADLREKMTSLELARYIKTHPHEFFVDYDYSMFIDGNVRITCDVKPLLYSMIENNKCIAIHRHQVRDCIYDEAKAIYAAGKASYVSIKNQINTYKHCGFPEHYGLFETNIVIRKQNDEDCVNVMNDWWSEMESHTKRDQLSFTYALWKNKRDSEFVFSLGNNSRRNPYFIVDSHN